MTTARDCFSCVHYEAVLDECHHPQAEFRYGYLKGMQNFMTPRAWQRWPAALSWCGFFAPTQSWLTKQKELA